MLATRTRHFLLPLTALLALTGCLDRQLQALAPCTQSGVVEHINVDSVDKVDLLFMIDNSGSMIEEQASLAREIPRLITVLTTGDLDGDGMEDFPPASSLQVGTITSDMGTNPYQAFGCSLQGEDGALRTRGNTASAGCAAAYAPFLSFSPGGNAAAFAADVTCVAVTGSGGCGFEQQLEAMLKALTPPNPAPAGVFDGTFLSGTGHAGPGGANDGFVRPDSLLAVIALSDEEDCSARDPNIFDDSAAADGVYGDPNTRCFRFGTAPGITNSVLFDTQRYVDGFLATRESKSLFIFAAIVGVPIDLAPAAGEPVNYDGILADPRMVEVDNTAAGDTYRPLVPSCDTANGTAFPPRRFVKVARDLNAAGAGGIVQSICQDDFRPALDAIIKKIADVIGGACLPRQLNPDENGLVSCDVIETMPASATACGPGREDIGVDADGKKLCKVTQLAVTGGAVPTGDGWYYDNFSADVLTRCGTPESTGQRITYTSNARPITGTKVKLECLQPVASSAGNDQRDVGVPCDPAVNTGACEDTCPTAGCCLSPRLICDPENRVWQQTCGDDSDCPGGFRCLTGRAAGLMSVCINPTC